MMLRSILLLLAMRRASCEISDYAKETALLWAPVIWLHPDEVFYPSSTAFYIDHMELRDADEAVVQADPQADTILYGEGTQDLHLNTKRDVQCVNCFQHFFYGQPLDDIEVYIYVKEYDDECRTVDVKYDIFFPFNYGKDVCVGLPVEGAENDCKGAYSTFGNHMSDWEGVTIRFRDGLPTDMKIDAHSFGAWYVYDELSNSYKYRDGEQMIEALDNDTARAFEERLGGEIERDDEGKPIQLQIQYPQEVAMVNGTHAEVFSANGSHGMWGGEGEWIYVKILWVNLNDDCKRGEAIKTWERVTWIDRNVESEEYVGTDLQWLDYRGKFGNIEKMECQFEFISGECGFEDSGGQPGTPSGPEDAYEACVIDESGSQALTMSSFLLIWIAFLIRLA